MRRRYRQEADDGRGRHEEQEVHDDEGERDGEIAVVQIRSGGGMTAGGDGISRFRPNPEWASLPIFDRTGWERLPFGEFVENLNERVEPADAAEEIYVGLEHLDPENLHIRRWGKGCDVIGTKLRFCKGDIIFGRRRAYQRKLAVAEFNGICSAHAMVVRAKPEMVLPEFLPFLMMSDRFMNRAVEISVGSLSPTINWKTLKKEEFDLPPLDRQRRIAEMLWAVEFSVKCSDELRVVLAAYRQSLLDSIAHEYSSLHALVPLDSIIAPGRPICYGILKPGLGTSDGIPVIKVRDYPDGYINQSDLLLTTPDIEAPYKRSRLNAGDLLLSIRGTIGRIAEVPATLAGANITQDTARISLSPEFNRYYIHAMLESRFVQNQIASRITGLAVQGLNIGEVRKLQIPLPPKSKQDEFASKIEILTEAQSTTTKHNELQRILLCTMSEVLFGSGISMTFTKSNTTDELSSTPSPSSD